MLLVSIIRIAVMYNLILIYAKGAGSQSFACVSLYNVNFFLNVYRMQNFVHPIPFESIPTQCAFLFAAIIQQGADEFSVKEWEVSCFKEFKMCIAFQVGIGNCSPNGHYAWELHRVTFP